MELDPVDEGVLVDRPRVRGAGAQGLAIGLAGLPDIRLGDRRERDELDRVDLDQTGPDPVAAALLDLRPLPQPDRQRDVAGQDVVAQLTAELHARTLAGERGARRPRRFRGIGATEARSRLLRATSGPAGPGAGCHRGPRTARRSPTGTRARRRRTSRRAT